MSSVPPNMPPAGGPPPPPFPPYDPKAQYRAWREQQKAARHAQHDAWKAQRRAARYGGAWVPRTPSIVVPILLILIGVIALLAVSGVLAAGQFWSWYGHWWPLLLIVAGLAMLGEWFYDAHRPTPVRRGGGFVGLIIALAVVGLCAQGWSRITVNAPWHDFSGDDDIDNFINAWGAPEHGSDQPAIAQNIPSNAVIAIQNPRGDVTVAAGEGSTLQVQAHLAAYTNSDSNAQKIFDAEKASVAVSGNSVLIKSGEVKNGRVNLTVTAPKGAQVIVTAGRGDVAASGLRAGLIVNAPHGDVRASDIAGGLQAHLASGQHDFSAHQILGDLYTDGSLNDLALSDIRGRVSINGEIFGNAHGENLAGLLTLHTSITQLQIAQLPGDFSLNSDLLHITQSKGPVRIVTHSKDVELTQIYGDSYIEDRNGRIAVEPAGAFSVEAKNTKGDVEIALPAGVSANVNLHARNGELLSDFPMPSRADGQEGQNKSAAFKIGSGNGVRIVASADNGDVRLKRGAATQLSPETESPAAPKSPKAPAAPGVPHLKAPKSASAQPVAQ
jgi:DUF4097 and DUF4098 domain-containing protein YvlB